MQAEPSTVGVSFMAQQTKQPPKETKGLVLLGTIVSVSVQQESHARF